MDRETAIRRRQGIRLKVARKAAGYRSGRAAALENGWPESTYRAHEKGTRTIGLDDAERYARRFQAQGVAITAKSILFEGGPGERPVAVEPASAFVLVPRLSSVAASKLADIGDPLDPNDAPTIPVADLPPGDWFALNVSGDSMDRIAPDGSTIFVNRRDRRLIPRKFYVFGYRGETTFKRYLDAPMRMLAPYSSNLAHEPIAAKKDLLVIGRVRRVVIDLA